jgi:hypothetical protein
MQPIRGGEPSSPPPYFWRTCSQILGVKALSPCFRSMTSVIPPVVSLSSMARVDFFKKKPLSYFLGGSSSNFRSNFKVGSFL